MTNSQNTSPAEDQQETGNACNDLTVKGRFARYNSSFLQLMLPVLTTRYVWLAVEDINPFNFLKKPDPALKAGFTPWKKPGPIGYISRNFAALGMGATILGLTGFYSKRTYDDIKTLYAESVGYELDKKPEDVTWHDLFVKSQNEALEVTRDAFNKRTAARAAAGSAFLFPWQIFRDWKNDKPKYDANANAGVGAVGVYLSVYESFLRKPSFFDVEQNLVATAITRDDITSHEIVKARDIQSLLQLQRRHVNKDYTCPIMNSPERENESVLSKRIADLLNQTYDNVKRHEKTNFTIGKFNFLVGFGLLDSFPASLAFVELANKSTDMKDVKQVAAAIRHGEDAQLAFQAHGIDMHGLADAKSSPVQQLLASYRTIGTDGAAADGADIKPGTSGNTIQAPASDMPVNRMASQIPSARDKIPAAARSPQEFAAQPGAQQLAI